MQIEKTVVQISFHRPVYPRVIEEHHVCLNADDALLAEKSQTDRIWFCEHFKNFAYQIQYLPEWHYHAIAAGWFHHMAEVLYWHYGNIFRLVRQGSLDFEWIESAERNLFESVNREAWRRAQMDGGTLIGEKCRNEWTFRDRLAALQQGFPALSERGFLLVQSILSVHLTEVTKEHASAFKTLREHQVKATPTHRFRHRSFPIPAMT